MYHLITQILFSIEFRINLIIFLTVFLFLFTFYQLLNSEYITKYLLLLIEGGIIFFCQYLIKAIYAEIDFCLQLFTNLHIYNQNFLIECFSVEFYIQILEIIHFFILIINIIMILIEIL